MSVNIVSVDYPEIPKPTAVVVEYDSALDSINGVDGKSRFEVTKASKVYLPFLGDVLTITAKDGRGRISWQTDFTETGLDALRLALNIKFDEVDVRFDCARKAMDAPYCNEDCPDGKCCPERYPD